MAMDVEKKHTKLRYVCVRVERNYKMAAMRLLGAFPKLQRATTRIVMSEWNISAPSGRILMKFDICIFFESLS